MDPLESQKPAVHPLINPARAAYRSVRFAYRKVRALKNSFLNLFDQPIIILLYHRVADLPSDPEMLAVAPENFRRHMEFLKQHYPIFRFEDDWSAIKEPAVAVTFDDGYSDNALEALPILEEFEIPATFFVSTGHIGTGKEFWWHRLENILLCEGEFPVRFRLEDSRSGRTWKTGNLEQRKIMYAALNALMQKISPDRREIWLDQLEKWSGSVSNEAGIHRSMLREELKRLATSPWATVGAHTVTHSALSTLDAEQQQREIFTSKKDLEDMTGSEITTFSYPFGRKQDYNKISVRLCREAGFVKAASNFPGQVHQWTDQYQLPRNLVRNWDLETFKEKLRQFWTR